MTRIFGTCFSAALVIIASGFVSYTPDMAIYQFWMEQGGERDIVFSFISEIISENSYPILHLSYITLGTLALSYLVSLFNMSNVNRVLVDEFEKLSEEYGLVCGNAEFIDSHGEVLYNEKNEAKDIIEFHTSSREDWEITTQFGLYKSLLIGNYIPVLSTLIKKEVFNDVGLYDETLSLEDWSMWLSLSKKYKMKYVDRVVAYYRWHDKNITKTMKNILAVDVVSILEREQNYCTENDLISVWRNKYYGALINLIRNKEYILFAKKVFKNNIALLLFAVVKKTLKRL